MRTIRWTLIGCVALVLAGCSSKYRQQLVGKWVCIEPAGKILNIEFANDGNVNFNGTPATYTVDGSENLHITTSRPVNGQTKFQTRIEISNDVLTMRDPDGTVLKFKRGK